MSVDVLREVFRLSESRGVARNVLTVLADAAHPDGVTWLPIVPSKDGDPTRCLTHRANASKRSIIDAVDALEQLGEVEVRQAQRGRRRFNVYRVRVGSIALTAVDYADLPFELDRPFSDGVQNPHLVSERDGVQESGDGVQFSSRRGADFVSDDHLENTEVAAASLPPRVPEASPKASIEASAAEPRTSTSGDPAAEHPVAKAELVEVVRGFPNADSGSPRIVERELGNLPAGVFRDAVEKTRARRGGVGLLIDFIRIARHERMVLASNQLREELGVNARLPHRPIMTADALKRDDPARYVRVFSSLPRELMIEALDGIDPDASLLTLYDAIAAGTEARDSFGTPEQERERWVRAHATDPDVDAVIDSWAVAAAADEVTTLHELAEQLRTATGESTSTREAA